MKKKISILGSTGSIGRSTADLILLHPDQFEVVGLVAGSQIEILADQIEKLKPKVVSIKNFADILKLKQLLKNHFPEVLIGDEGAKTIAGLKENDLVISAIVGAKGLLPTLEALNKGIDIGLANKESMVIAGEIMLGSALKSGAKILPVDSEHSALFQCLNGQNKKDVKKLILTASGGPFLHKPLNEFLTITKSEALKHPNWDMGPKITIDSATMMNKGLEVMEAQWLFDFQVSQIDVCVHPQSIIHSMVEYKDGSIISQMGVPDMKAPIAYALSYPNRIATGVKPLNLFEQKELTFYKPDFEKFPSLKLAYDAAEKKQTYPAVLNAANEIAVDAFLNDKISFVQIPEFVEKALNAHVPTCLKTLEDVLLADQWARETTLKIIEKKVAA